MMEGKKWERRKGGVKELLRGSFEEALQLESDYSRVPSSDDR